MLVKELDVAVVDSLCDIFADLVGASPLDHVVARPSVLGLGARRGTNEEVVLELALKAILLDMVGQCSGSLLRVADTGETTPALRFSVSDHALSNPNSSKLSLRHLDSIEFKLTQVFQSTYNPRVVREVLNQILSLRKLGKI